MNREIKFRAWDKGTSTMKYSKPYYDGIGYCPEELKGEYCPAELIDNNGHQSHISDVLMNSDLYIPMQYTGLKDRNGKEIYEGDIVRWSIWPEDSEETKVIDTVGFSNGCFRSNKRYQLLCLIEPHRGVEVIGNIHENPELLNEISQENRI